jgi:alkylation response protein AidB-like acyl-CoA dehydrogenase
MDFAFGEEEDAAAALARTILEDHATNARLKELEQRAAAYDERLWQDLARADLLGIAVPEADGGSGLGFVALCRLLQEVGRTVAPVPAFAALVLGALPLAGLGEDAPERAWLADIVRGERLVTAALSELSSSDPLIPATRAAGNGADIRLTGVKTNVPYAEQATHILVPALCDDGAIGLFYVERHGDGTSLAAQQTPDGQPHARLELDDAAIAARLDEPGRGAETLRRLVERATAARCVMQLGVTERALEMTAAYSRERIQFDRPIGSFQAVHQRAADAYIQVESIRLTAWEAAWRLSEDRPAAEHVMVAKYVAAEGGQFAAFACQHLHGGVGIDTDYPLHRYFKWALQIEHELGSARHQLDRLGRLIAADGVPAA